MKPTVCMKEASENVLIPACDELLFKTYGLRKVENIMSCIAQFRAYITNAGFVSLWGHI